jgi:hypothetical protein
MGVSANVSVDSVRVSPDVTDFADVNAALPRNVPAVLAVQNEMCEIVSEPADHDVHDTVPLIDLLPADAADHDTDLRVVSALAAVVPEAPGSAV